MKIYRIAKRIDWDKVDWSKPTQQIATELNTNPSYVSGKRRKYAPETIGKTRDSVWPKVDWNKRNVDIAKEIGATQALVATQRRKYAPETVYRPKEVDWKNIDWNKIYLVKVVHNETEEVSFRLRRRKDGRCGIDKKSGYTRYIAEIDLTKLDFKKGK